MARRARTSAADDIMDLVARLPWWAGVTLAAASYLLLSALAAAPVQVTAAGAPAGGLVISVFIKGLATAGQIIVPLICLAGAGLSAFRRRQREQLLPSATTAAGSIDGMRWQEFEMLVAEAFRRQGYRVLESGGGGADGGVDLVLSRPAQNGNEKTLVQCKHWRAYKVGVDVVRELYGVMAARGAAAGIVVTSGRFTTEAQAFAQGRNVRLVDGPALDDLIRTARTPASDRPALGEQAAGRRPVDAAASRPVTASASPECPHCGKPMVQRVAKRGPHSGSTFWGCTGYPACRGTRDRTP